jgi:flagellar motility protein MotE (MotC chaperone)
MNAFLRDLRLLPIVLIATACLLALKTADLVFDDGLSAGRDNGLQLDSGPSVVHAAPDALQAQNSNLSWAQQMFNFPDGKTPPLPGPEPIPSLADRANGDIITGSVEKKSDKGEGDKTEEAKAGEGKAANGKAPGNTVIKFEGQTPPTNAERAILERLQQRRQELDARARELDIRESLLKAAEKRMEGQLTELKAVESRIADETKKKDDAEAARLKGLITMYETMKAKDAAKIFDRLDSAVLLQVASQINPRQMAEILAQMTPDTAQHLTVELASQAQTAKPGTPAELPKIEGRPATP